jgi:hypothetical protein
MKSKATMNSWKIKIIEKKNKGRQESGKSKGLVPDQLARYMCKCNRSYKHKQYLVVMARLGKRKGK